MNRNNGPEDSLVSPEFGLNPGVMREIQLLRDGIKVAILQLPPRAIKVLEDLLSRWPINLSQWNQYPCIHIHLFIVLDNGSYKII